MTEHNTAVVLAAGQGSRMQTTTPKQYLNLSGKPVLAWSLQAFQQFDGIDDIILVTSGSEIDLCRSICEKYEITKLLNIVEGGAERCLSVWNALQAINAVCGDKGEEDGDRYVFIHDAARPALSQGMLRRALDSVRRDKACVAGMPVKNTIKIADEEGYSAGTPKRSLVWEVQTPQVFSFPLIYDCFSKMIAEGFTDVTDDAMVVERESNVKVRLVEGSYRNIKVTTPEDLAIARLFLEGEKDDE